MQIEILKFIQTINNSFFDVFFQFVTMLGEENVIVVLAAVVFLSIDKDKGYKLIFTIASNTCFNSFVKTIFKVQRPIGIEGIESLRTHTATSYSFPSGHTQSSSAFWTSLYINFKNRKIAITGIFVVVLIAISRLYLGVHWPTDVISAGLFGLIWAICASKVFDYIHNNKNYVLLISISLFFVLCTLLFGDEDFCKSSGLLLGLSLGYVVETKYINFSIKMDTTKKVILYVVFLGGLLLIKGVLKLILPTAMIFNIIRYFAVGFYALGVAPWVGKKFN